MYRLGQVARKLNVGTNTIVEFLTKKGFTMDSNPNSKITEEQFALLSKEFADSAQEKVDASHLTIGKHSENVIIKTSHHKPDYQIRKEEEEILIKDNTAAAIPEVKEQAPSTADLLSKPKLEGPKVIGKIDLEARKAPEIKQKEKEPEVAPEPEPIEAKVEVQVEILPRETTPQEETPVEQSEKQEVIEQEVKLEKLPETGEIQVIEAKAESLKGLTVLGKIELPTEKKKQSAPINDPNDKKKRPRKRMGPVGSSTGSTIQGQNRPSGQPNRDNRPHQGGGQAGQNRFAPRKTEELTDKEIQDQIKATLAKLSGGGNKQNTQSRSKYRKDKRTARAEAEEEKALQAQEDSKKLKVTEFISANDLATLMGVSVNDVISTCLNMGMFVSINQRLDAESITFIADEFGFEVEFSTAEEEEEEVQSSQDSEENLSPRAPIVTIMGHVDHGKTSLLDYIRESKVTEGEAGGITQHIGAYDVMTSTGKRIAFLDTPGHEAFTAMRARGAKITDIVIIVVAADDSVMPQTKEAINHAMNAGVPIVIAINKIDKPNADPEKIKSDLAQINILVEDWGGKYQCQHISAKTGQGIEELLEKVLLEAEILDLKANPQRLAIGSVIEAELDKGRGYVTTIMVQNGTLRVGDIILAGQYHGRVKAMFDYKGKRLKEVLPSTPVQILGLSGAPQSGDKIQVMETEREAREIANKREQLQREQSMRTKRHITLDEIGRRLAIGNFKQLNVIVKGDVDGSVEALSDSLLKLSTPEIQVAIIHKGVGQISESDVLLASAADAVILGFQVRPSANARKLAENEEIEIRLYSIIYDAINQIKDAMEGLLAPTMEETITGNIAVREVFKISKVGTVAGCYVTDGIVKRANKIRLIRDGIVVHEGEINQLKRFKDDVGEVKNGYECGLSIKNYNDILVGDIIEGFEIKEVKRKL